MQPGQTVAVPVFQRSSGIVLQRPGSDKSATALALSVLDGRGRLLYRGGLWGLAVEGGSR